MKMQKHTKTVKASEKVASVDNLLIQILVKLPIKQLFRFKVVRRQWLFLTTSHEFNLMRNPTPNPARGIFLRIRDEDDNRYRYEYIPLFPNLYTQPPPPFMNLHFTTNPAYTTILSSCDGLLLCAIHDHTKTYETFLEQPDRSMYVYNPTTNLSTTLPDFALVGDRVGATLVFDPAKSSHYKVVMVVRMHSLEGSKLLVYVYWSETQGWSSEGPEIVSLRGGLRFGNGVYWNGSVHWLNKELSPRNPQVSLRFHVDFGTLEEMPSPPVVREDTFSCENPHYFGESSDHLHFVEPVLPIFNVYEMNRDYSGWFAKYRVDISVFIGDHPEVIKKCDFDGRNYFVVCALSLVRGENDEDSKLVLRIPGKAVKLNLVRGTWEKLCDIQHCNIHGSFGRSITSAYSGLYYFYGESGLDYIQSLCSV